MVERGVTSNVEGIPYRNPHFRKLWLLQNEIHYIKIEKYESFLMMNVVHDTVGTMNAQKMQNLVFMYEIHIWT